MKSSKMLKLIIIIISVIGISISGCKKRIPDTPAPDTSSLQQLSIDDAQIQASDNQVTNDANGVLSSTSSKLMDTTISNCSITIDSLNHGDTIVYTLVYNGVNSGHNFTRKGTVIIEKLKSVHWQSVGASVTFQYLN